MELEEIIERCKNKERQGQSQLYIMYSRQMLRICYRFVADKQIAQDLMHDGFIIIFASISSLQQPEKIERWMGRIMTNLALRYIKQTRSVPFISLSDLGEEQLSDDTEVILDTLSLDKLLAMVEMLPDGYRMIFKLSVLDGLSHKEIADLLHIAPHSSSSQLYRAKKYLKKMIIQYQYQILSLALLLIPICYLLFWNESSKERINHDNVIVKPVVCDAINNISDSIIPIYVKKHICQEKVAEIISLTTDTVTKCSKEIDVDTVKSAEIILKLGQKKRIQDNNRGDLIISSSKKQSNWTIAFEYSGGIDNTCSYAKSLRTPTDGDISSSPIPPYTDNWSDYYNYLQKYGHTLEDQKEVQSLMNIAQYNSGMIEEKRYHHLPFTVGILFHKSLDKCWGIETGINYTYLISDFKTGNDAFISERQKVHYIGIPLRGTYIWSTFKAFSIYSSVGITMEMPISVTLKTEYMIDGKVDYSKQHSLKAPLQWSIDCGFGIQYKFTPSVGLFIEPKLNYYFNEGSELKTIRKEHPLNFSMPIGIRFSY
ncbi:MAG: sigma-70 family RNA polymerase sigma factor [Muribaculaceae bacterium]